VIVILVVPSSRFGQPPSWLNGTAGTDNAAGNHASWRIEPIQIETVLVQSVRRIPCQRIRKQPFCPRGCALSRASFPDSDSSFPDSDSWFPDSDSSFSDSDSSDFRHFPTLIRRFPTRICRSSIQVAHPCGPMTRPLSSSRSVPDASGECPLPAE
jgi:hypothetical protein